jgi:manganese/zinc/iron transport system permease protein
MNDKFPISKSAGQICIRSRAGRHSFWVVAALLVATFSAHAARIGDLTESNIGHQAMRFFTLQDPSVRYALIGSILLGITCGLLGSFIVVRKMALVGDALSHAVLPGVALGFLWNMDKNPLTIFIGATFAGLLGTATVSAIKQTTRLKEDTILGMVLAGFFSIGICLVTMIQRLPTGNKSGVDKFLFGQAAAMSADDVTLMAIITAVSILAITLFYKEFLVASFDEGFARATGFPIRVIHHALMFLLAFAVVIALQAVGVVLVSAMLITPAAAAYLLTDRMHRMLVLAAVFGMIAGVTGAFFSFLGPSLPTGPFMVLGASAVFGLAFLFGPRHGVVVRWWNHRSRSQRIQNENTLKFIYRVLENRNFQGDGVSMAELADIRNESHLEARKQAGELRKKGFATLAENQTAVFLTPQGWQRACSIVRNHRLWELYLTSEAKIAADHVHEDAEKIEHVLGEEAVRELERRLQYATKDPHGRPIPSLADMQLSPDPQSGLVGYGKKS